MLRRARTSLCALLGLTPPSLLSVMSSPPARLPCLPPALQSHTVGPCSLSQVVAAETLRAWGDEGLDAHLRSAQVCTRGPRGGGACCAVALLHALLCGYIN